MKTRPFSTAHLRDVIARIGSTGGIELCAIGIRHDVSGLYPVRPPGRPGFRNWRTLWSVFWTDIWFPVVKDPDPTGTRFDLGR